MNQESLFADTIRHVAKLCAVAATTAPKSGGQLFIKGGKPFIETVIVEDKAVLKRLADWLREQGTKHQDAIWFRDADTAEKLDLVLFIGVREWYPPQYDCGACGYATCAEFLQSKPQHQKP
ncbi:MAG TPA: (Fe-S)-binding protein, partial [Verrucomicrobiae bacterium]